MCGTYTAMNGFRLSFFLIVYLLGKNLGDDRHFNTSDAFPCAGTLLCCPGKNGCLSLGKKR